MNAEIEVKAKVTGTDSDMPAGVPRGVLHFAGFEVDLERGELRLCAACLSGQPSKPAVDQG
jgi:hypothetical protein